MTFYLLASIFFQLGIEVHYCRLHVVYLIPDTDVLLRIEFTTAAQQPQQIINWSILRNLTLVFIVRDSMA